MHQVYDTNVRLVSISWKGNCGNSRFPRIAHYTCVRARVQWSMAPVRQLKGFKSRISVVLGIVTITGLVLWNTKLPSEYLQPLISVLLRI